MWFGIVLAGVAIIGIYAWVQASRRCTPRNSLHRPRRTASTVAAQSIERERQRQARQHAVQRQAACAMQVAISNCRSHPTFVGQHRLAASGGGRRAGRVSATPVWTAAAPATRGAACRRAEWPKPLQHGQPRLRELIGSFGVAGYEADTSRSKLKSGSGPSIVAATTYRDRLRQLQAAHRERLEAIRATPDLDPRWASNCRRRMRNVFAGNVR